MRPTDKDDGAWARTYVTELARATRPRPIDKLGAALLVITAAACLAGALQVLGVL